jgi:hypothetical protein
MCRNLSQGGRICPCASDPAKIAKRNARRRARYAEQKIAKQDAFGQVGETVETHAGDPLKKNHSVFSYEAGFGHDIPLYEPGELGKDEALGVSWNEHSGYFVDRHYLDVRQVSGQIDYTKLDEKSYETFGFKGEEDVRDFQMTPSEYATISENELADLTIAEKKALMSFTGDEFRWINGALFANTEDGVYLYSGDDEEYGENNERYSNEPYSESRDIPEYAEMVDEEAKTPQHLKEVVALMDSAMAKAPQQQRTVYRGMSNFHSAFAQYQNIVSDYVDENLNIGQEVVFDGYQSTSVSPSSAANYAGNMDGLIFEMKTSSGLNVQDLSTYSEEQEVLLPRNTRFMVVGIQHPEEYSTEDKFYGWEDRQNMTIVQLVEIDDKGFVRNESNYSAPPALREDQLQSSSDTSNIVTT